MTALIENSSSEGSEEEEEECGRVKEEVKDDCTSLPGQRASWREHILTFLSSILRTTTLSDLVVHCRDGKLPAHRVVLAASNHLRPLLQVGLSTTTTSNSISTSIPCSRKL